MARDLFGDETPPPAPRPASPPAPQVVASPGHPPAVPRPSPAHPPARVVDVGQVVYCAGRAMVIGHINADGSLGIEDLPPKKARRPGLR